MMTLVTGGSASGKSDWAERFAAAGGAPRWYIATMEPLGGEAEARIARHRTQRAGRGFQTLECYTSLATQELPAGGTVLLDCLGNLAANELFSPAGAGERAVEAILAGVEQLADRCDNLVVVTNDIFADGADYPPETLRYLAVLGELNRRLARRADRVVEVVCGIPIFHKGDVV